MLLTISEYVDDPVNAFGLHPDDILNFNPIIRVGSDIDQQIELFEIFKGIDQPNKLTRFKDYEDFIQHVTISAISHETLHYHISHLIGFLAGRQVDNIDNHIAELIDFDKVSFESSVSVCHKNESE